MVIKGHLFSRSTLGAKQSASLKRNFSDGNPMRGGSRLIYYLLCFSFSQTISTVFWRLCLPSGFQQLSWCTSTSGSFYLLCMYVCNCILCGKCVHVCISGQGLHGGGEAGEYARARARDVQLGCCPGVDIICIMAKCVVVIVCVIA